MKYTFHMVTMPHVQVSRAWNACAYTQKDVRFARMVRAHGHKVIMYANEGSNVAVDEMVPMLTEEERASWFGSHDRQKLYHLLWDSNQPYWQAFAAKAIPALKARVKKGDFILSLSGCCHQPIAEHFANCYSGITNEAMWVEYGCGYFGTFSRYIVYESETHRSWMHGARGHKTSCNDDAAIGNYFDPDDFKPPVDSSIRVGGHKIIKGQPYYLFVGRIVPDKGWGIAVDVTRDIKAKLILAGQGETGPLPPHVKYVGHVSIEQRNWLMSNAIATFTPTDFREPFGGTATETQLCGTPAISTDHGAFVETVERPWRCASHREFVEAAKRAKKLTPADRQHIRDRAMGLYSFEAIYPQYMRYFDRLYSRWADGWYFMGEPEDIKLPP
jgi:glycosyltransferase involved in cell wall biosynthesis